MIFELAKTQTRFHTIPAYKKHEIRRALESDPVFAEIVYALAPMWRPKIQRDAAAVFRLIEHAKRGGSKNSIEDYLRLYLKDLLRDDPYFYAVVERINPQWIEDHEKFDGHGIWVQTHPAMIRNRIYEKARDGIPVCQLTPPQKRHWEDLKNSCPSFRDLILSVNPDWDDV